MKKCRNCNEMVNDQLQICSNCGNDKFLKVSENMKQSNGIQGSVIKETGSSNSQLIIVNIIGVLVCLIIVTLVLTEVWNYRALLLIVIVGGIMGAVNKKMELNRINKVTDEKSIPVEQSLLTQEQIATTCKIIFHRDKSFVGALVPQFVYLNGTKMGEVENGESIEFETNVKSNIINVKDHVGGTFKDSYQFDAVENEIIEIHFCRKFK